MMALSPQRLDTDFSSIEYQNQLYARYRQMHTNNPVFTNNEGVVYLVRHDDCLRLLRSPEFRRTAVNSGQPFDTRTASPLEIMINQWMVFMDPPRHDHVRQGFAAPFVPRELKRLESWIDDTTQAVIKGLPLGENVDILRVFAETLPVQVIAHLMGIPETDQPQFHQWACVLTDALDTATAASLQRGSQTAKELSSYIKNLLTRRDLLPHHSLLRTGPAVDLTSDEWLYGCAMLLWAGHETTKNLIANGLLLLTQHPQQLLQMREQPSLVAGTIEEVLRFDSPVQKLSRWTSSETRFGDYAVPAHSLVTAMVGAANRDEREFPEPDTFNINRGKTRHLAFGAGIHHCLGAPLSRLEAQVAFRALLLTHNIEVSSYQWRPHAAFRSLDHLRVTLTPI